MFGQYVDGMVRGLRGDVNLRMKNFRGIGIGVPASYLEFRSEIEKQIKEHLELPVFIEDRDVLIKAGESWLTDVRDIVGHQFDPNKIDIRGVYGAAKLIIEHTE